MHKSWGNAIDFDEAAERMGVDVMRWMFAKARPEENILFGWHAADEARRELLVLWNVYAFFVTYARLADWTPVAGEAPPVPERGALDRWILSRAAGTAAAVEEHLRDLRRGRGDPRALGRSWTTSRPGTCACRASGCAATTTRPTAPRRSRRSTRRSSARPGCSPRSCRSCPTRCTATSWPTAADRPDCVHLTRWPTADLAGAPRRSPGARRWRSRRTPWTSPGRSAARPASAPASRWPTPGSPCPTAASTSAPDLLAIIADEINVKQVSVIADDSDLVERRVKPLLPKIGKRLGSAIPAVMAAARDGSATFHPDGSVTLGGVTLAPDEVEIQASPRPGTAVADRDGLVMVIDTELTPELRAEGDARELQRAVQDLRRDAGLELDDRIDLWIEGLAPGGRRPPRRRAARDARHARRTGRAPADATARATVELESGSAAVALRRRVGDG